MNTFNADNLTFPLKLWRMVNAKNDVIYWGTNGKSILINYTELEKYLIHFTMNDIPYRSIFIKELQNCGFNKINRKIKRNASNKILYEYQHKYFQLGRLDLLKLIERNNVLQNYTIDSKCDITTRHNIVDPTKIIINKISPLTLAREKLRLTLKMKMMLAKDLNGSENIKNIPVFEVPSHCFENYLEDVPKYVQRILEQNSQKFTDFYVDCDSISTQSLEVPLNHPNSQIIAEYNIIPPLSTAVSESYVEMDSSNKYVFNGENNTIINEALQESNIKEEENVFSIEMINEDLAPLNNSIISYEIPLIDEGIENCEKFNINDITGNARNELTNFQPEVYIDQLQPLTNTEHNILPPFSSTFNINNEFDPYREINFENFPDEIDMMQDHFNERDTLENVEYAMENFLNQIRASIDMLNN